MGRPSRYDNDYASVTQITDQGVHFDPTGWYEGKRAELKRKGVNLNKVNPIQECKKHKQNSIGIGHWIHAGIEKFVRGTSFDEAAATLKSNDERVMLSYLTNWCSEHKPTPVLMEKALYSHKYKFAGTPDMIATLKSGKSLVVVDWKTDGNPRTKQQDRERQAKYLWQAAGYSIAYQEEYGKKISTARFVRASKDLKFAEYKFSAKELTEGRKEFLYLREIYRRVWGK